MLSYEETVRIGKQVQREAKQHKLKKRKQIRETIIIGIACVIIILAIIML